MITVIGFKQFALLYQVQISDIQEDLDKIFYKDFSNGNLDKNQPIPMISGTLLLTAEGNTNLFTAELF